MEATRSLEQFLPVIDDIRSAARNDPMMNKALIDLDNVARDNGMDPDVYLFMLVRECDGIRKARDWVQTKVLK